VPKHTNEQLQITADDYFILLTISAVNIWFAGALDFYLNIPLPAQPFMYLEGSAYEGEFEIKNQFTNLFLGSVGGITVNMEFLENFKLRICNKSLLVSMFSGSSTLDCETVNYWFTGTNKIAFKNNQGKKREIQVKNNSQTLVLATDRAKVVMDKVY
jgi:hypothetical protein